MQVNSIHRSSARSVKQELQYFGLEEKEDRHKTNP